MLSLCLLILHVRIHLTTQMLETGGWMFSKSELLVSLKTKYQKGEKSEIPKNKELESIGLNWVQGKY